jgi:hypothetical protein
MNTLRAYDTRMVPAGRVQTPFTEGFKRNPGSWQPLIYFLPLWICLFWTFHINGNHVVCGFFLSSQSTSTGYYLCYYHIIVVLGVHCGIYKSAYLQYVLVKFTATMWPFASGFFYLV